MFDPKPINIDTDSAAGWLKLFAKHLKKKIVLFLLVYVLIIFHILLDFIFYFK